MSLGLQRSDGQSGCANVSRNHVWKRHQRELEANLVENTRNFDDVAYAAEAATSPRRLRSDGQLCRVWRWELRSRPDVQTYSDLRYGNRFSYPLYGPKIKTRDITCGSEIRAFSQASLHHPGFSKDDIITIARGI